jgi:hypothetical protein
LWGVTPRSGVRGGFPLISELVQIFRGGEGLVEDSEGIRNIKYKINK